MNNNIVVDYQGIIDQLGTCISLALPIAIFMGISERLISLVLDAMLDRIGRRERL